MKQDERRSIIIGWGDVFLVPLAYAGANFIRFGTLAEFRNKFSPLFLLILTVSYVVVFYFFDLYAVTRKIGNRTLAGRVLLAVGTAAVLASLVKYTFFLFPIGRGVLVMANALLAVFVFIWRKAGVRLLRMMGNPSVVLVVGRGEGTDEIISLLSRDQRNYRILGLLVGEDEATGPQEGEAGVPVLGSPFMLGDIIRTKSIQIVVLGKRGTSLSISAEALLQAHRGGIEILDVNEMYQRLRYRIPVDYIRDDSWFLQTKGFALANNQLAGRAKRVFDVALTGVLLLVSLPLWPLLSLMIKIDSKGPIFYRQKRVGKNEAEFCLHKFRSMIEKAEDKAPIWAHANDRRVTRIGRFMRKIHLDELPQLWNVLRGDMSLVGPRPERPEFVRELKKDVPFYALRHLVKPGLTGWAQINYRYASSTIDSKIKLEYDLYYISRMNLLFDIKIIMATFSGAPSGGNTEV